MSSQSGDMSGSQSPPSRLPTSAPSSPPEQPIEDEFDPEFATTEEKAWYDEEQKARLENDRAEERRRKLALKKKKQVEESKSEREAKARQLDELLKKSAAFSDILTKKTEVLGRVGSGFDGKTLGEHDLVMAKQPKCMVGGTMRDYQLEGLTWMFEICSQGMSGILADEMGLGKTIQTISLIALLRENEGYLGPHLVVAPLSTMSNWMEEFEKWVPSIPIVLYHGTPDHRAELREEMMKHLVNGRPTKKFPVVCTTPEIVLRDQASLSKIKWEFIIIDEGHRLKNSESKLFAALRIFESATRLLITGTPLQNNLKELWSLLNFLLPTIFTNWEQFESWFDFSDLQDQKGTEEFLQDQMKQDLVKKMHLILQPLLLRRIKADVEHLLPKKREYVLYAPMTEEQTDLYNALSNPNVDARKYLEDKVVERLNNAKKTPPISRKATPKTGTKKAIAKKEESDSEDDTPLRQLALRGRQAEGSKHATPKNAFQQMMQRKPSSNAKPSSAAKPKSLKRKSQEALVTPAPKSAKSSRSSTPARNSRGRKARGRKSYTEADATDEEALSDDEFEKKLAEELGHQDEKDEEEKDGSPEEIERAKTLELARKEIMNKKLGNELMQLRLVCNSPHNFFNPFITDADVDETVVTSSGKMLLLDRLLPSLFKRGSKVLIFSQFKTQLDILDDYARVLRRWKVCRIDGTVAQEDRRKQIKEFNENPDFKLFLLSTRSGGQGINLASADTVIIFDSDWNPQQDLQAQDRAHRIGQKNPVVVFRLATKGTVEEELLLTADAKRRLEKLVIKKGGFKTMGQKLDKEERMSEEALKTLLLKDGQVYTYKGGDEILSDADLDTLCDRSDEAYARAEKGLGDAEGFKIVETKIGGLMTGMEKKSKA